MLYVQDRKLRAVRIAAKTSVQAEVWGYRDKIKKK
jgi:hypothetical protein